MRLWLLSEVESLCCSNLQWHGTRCCLSHQWLGGLPLYSLVPWWWWRWTDTPKYKHAHVTVSVNHTLLYCAVGCHAGVHGLQIGDDKATVAHHHSLCPHSLQGYWITTHWVRSLWCTSLLLHLLSHCCFLYSFDSCPPIRPQWGERW